MSADGFLPSEFMEAYLREAGLLWDHDPDRTLNVPPPPRPGEVVTICDERGQPVWEGKITDPRDNFYTVAASAIQELPATGARWHGNAEDFTINPTTKETRMDTKITISAGRRGGSLMPPQPFVDVSVETDATLIEQVETTINAAQLAGEQLARAVGLEPYVEPAVNTAVVAPHEDLTSELADLDQHHEAPTIEEPQPETFAEEQRVAQARFERQRVAMFEAIGNSAPTFTDIVRDLREVDEENPVAERLLTLATSLEQETKALLDARNPRFEDV
jgi:hypothetical protein